MQILNDLYQLELNSTFRFLGDGAPYIGPGQLEIRKSFAGMVEINRQHAGGLFDLIDRLGGIPAETGFVSNEPFSAYLSIAYLLPRLLTEKAEQIRRYEAALQALVDPPAEVNELLHRHLAEHHHHMSILETAMSGKPLIKPIDPPDPTTPAVDDPADHTE